MQLSGQSLNLLLELALCGNLLCQLIYCRADHCFPKPREVRRIGRPGAGDDNGNCSSIRGERAGPLADTNLRCGSYVHTGIATSKIIDLSNHG